MLAAAAIAAVAADRALQATSQQAHRCAAVLAQVMTRGPAVVGDALVDEANATCEGQHHCGCGRSRCHLPQWRGQWRERLPPWVTLR